MNEKYQIAVWIKPVDFTFLDKFTESFAQAFTLFIQNASRYDSHMYLPEGAGS